MDNPFFFFLNDQHIYSPIEDLVDHTEALACSCIRALMKLGEREEENCRCVGRREERPPEGWRREHACTSYWYFRVTHKNACMQNNNCAPVL